MIAADTSARHIWKTWCIEQLLPWMCRTDLLQPGRDRRVIAGVSRDFVRRFDVRLVLGTVSHDRLTDFLGIQPGVKVM
jgi:hypothetical protein